MDPTGGEAPLAVDRSWPRVRKYGVLEHADGQDSCAWCRLKYSQSGAYRHAPKCAQQTGAPEGSLRHALPPDVTANAVLIAAPVAERGVLFQRQTQHAARLRTGKAGGGTSGCDSDAGPAAQVEDTSADGAYEQRRQEQQQAAALSEVSAGPGDPPRATPGDPADAGTAAPVDLAGGDRGPSTSSASLPESLYEGSSRQHDDEAGVVDVASVDHAGGVAEVSFASQQVGSEGSGQQDEAGTEQGTTQGTEAGPENGAAGLVQDDGDDQLFQHDGAAADVLHDVGWAGYEDGVEEDPYMAWARQRNAHYYEAEDGGPTAGPAPAAGRSCNCGCGQKYFRPGTAPYYEVHLDRPLYNGCPYSLRQVLYNLLQIHNDMGVSKTLLDLLVGYICVILPEGHFLPPTVYMMGKVIGAQTWDEYEVHVCAADGCPGHVYIDDDEEKCPICGADRYMTTRVGERQVKDPRWWYIDFGAKEAVVKRLHSRPRFCAERGRWRHQKDEEAAAGGAGAAGHTVAAPQHEVPAGGTGAAPAGTAAAPQQQAPAGGAGAAGHTVAAPQHEVPAGGTGAAPAGTAAAPQQQAPAGGTGAATAAVQQQRRRGRSQAAAVRQAAQQPQPVPGGAAAARDQAAQQQHQPLQGEAATEPQAQAGGTVAAAVGAVPTIDGGDFRRGTLFARTAESVGPLEMESWRTSSYRLLYDWVEPYSSVRQSLGVVGIRCEDVSPRNRGKKHNVALVFIIPEKCSNVRPFFVNTVKDFSDMSHAGGGVLVKQRFVDVNGEPFIASYTHYAYLAGVMADSVARVEAGNYVGLNSKIGGCHFCTFEGEHASGAIRFKGYKQRVAQPLRQGSARLLVGDARLQRTSTDYKECAERAEQACKEYRDRVISQAERDRRFRENYCKGQSAFAAIPELPQQETFLVPAAHALLYGVVSNFFTALFRPPGLMPADPSTVYIFTHEQRREMKARGKNIVFASDFGRNYKCIVDHRGSYKMEDWLHYVETFSAYILKDMLHARVVPMWQHLVAAIAHYFRPVQHVSREAFVAAATAGAQHLLEYAQAAETLGFPDTVFTNNLHICVCRLLGQELSHGAVAGSLELVVERLMQLVKAYVKSHGSACPAKIAANRHLLECAMDDMVQQHPDLLDIKDMLGRKSHNRERPEFDAPDSSGVVLLGAGEHAGFLSPEAAADLITALKTSAKHEVCEAFRTWTQGSTTRVLNTDAVLRVFARASDAPAYVYKRAEVDEEEYDSASYHRPRSRVSYYALLHYSNGSTGASEPYIAKLKCFLKLPAQEATGQQRVRVAIASLTKVEEVEHRRLYKARLNPNPRTHWEWYAIPMSTLQAGKVQRVIVATEEGAQGSPGVRYFMPYWHMTNR